MHTTMATYQLAHVHEDGVRAADDLAAVKKDRQLGRRGHARKAARVDHKVLVGEPEVRLCQGSGSTCETAPRCDAPP